MKIGINALSVTSGGGLVSLQGLLPALRKADPNNDFVVFLSGWQLQRIGPMPNGVSVSVFPSILKFVVLRVLFEQALLPLVLWIQRCEWLYSLGNQTVLLAPCKVMLLMENPNPYSPLSFSWTVAESWRLRVLRLLGYLSCLRATKIRFLTKNSRDIICSRVTVRPEKIVVIPQGVDLRIEQTDRGQALRVLNIEGSYILTAANMAPHKNLVSLMSAFDNFVSKTGYKGYLAVPGSDIYARYATKVRSHRQTLAAGERIIFPGWLSSKELQTLFQHADLFVFLSLEETFGMPLVEAMANGVPVLASRVESGANYFIPFEEICGDAAHYCDPFSIESITESMTELMQDRSWGQELVNRGRKRSQEFSWEIVAQKLSVAFSS